MKVTVLDKKATPCSMTPDEFVTLICRDQAGEIIEVDPFVTALAFEDDEQSFAVKALGKAFTLSDCMLLDGVYIPTGFQPVPAINDEQMRLF